ncbi:3903_t:CDS:10 [Funneliformis caledonium]|uniref:3903_t:CDS:1 n=1 Tax=Funneliformis caledonium TaxID=1117310 RepID=A0A9N9BP75_9GLOM|nr:3903_t:CDS:10 [Funneliformis caledonium]
MNPIKENTASPEHSIEPVTTHTRNKIVLRANRSTTHKPRNSSGGGGGSNRTYNKRSSKKNKLIKTSKTRNKNKEIISTSKEVNESRIIPVEEPPREELPYDRFFPDLKIDEKLVVVYVSSKDLVGDRVEEKEVETTITKEENGEIAARNVKSAVQTQEYDDVNDHSIAIENNMTISTSTTEQAQIEEIRTTIVLLNNNHQEDKIQEVLPPTSNIHSIKGSGCSQDSFASLPKNFEETSTPKDSEEISSSKDLNEEMSEETPSPKISSRKSSIEKTFRKDAKDDHDDDTASFKASSHDDMDEETIDEDEQDEMQIELENSMMKLPSINYDVTVENKSLDKEMDWIFTNPIVAADDHNVVENGVKKDQVIVEGPSTAIITTVEDNMPIAQPPPVKKLPVPSFKRINFTKEEPDETFVRPEGHYIRHVELSEKDLVEIVEYDMDEQGIYKYIFCYTIMIIYNLDDYWLKSLNEERRKDDLGEISADVFEATKNLPKGNTDKDSMTPEDSTCAICDDGECENSNAIVFCDGCNLAVHQGQWLCRKCIVSPETPVSCIFCPNEGGAFKKTNTNRWAHLLCALWIPEVGLSNTVYMEPIDNIEGIPRGRWKLKCYICEKRMGACIQCQNTHCCTAFHVTCARKAKLCMRMKFPDENHNHYIMKAYCDKHTPRDYREQIDVASTVAAAQKLLMDPVQTGKRRRHDIDYGTDESDDYVPSDSEEEDMEDQYIDKTEISHSRKTRKRKQTDDVTSNRKTNKALRSIENGQVAQSVENKNSKAARAYNHTYTDTAPVAPAVIMEKVLPVLARQKGTMRKKPELITIICKYWSLKREFRRGAPLLKRLHLEPWTASASAHKQSEEEKWAKYMAMTDLRKDLEKVRMLVDLVHRREKEKLKKTRLQVKYLETILFPLDYILRPALEEIVALDKNEIFAKPVSIEEVPDYLIHITHPMDFGTMRKKIDAHEYSLGSGLQGFKDDLELVFRNAMTYNTSDTIYYRVAKKLQIQSQSIVANAEQDYSGLNIDPKKGVLDVPLHPEIFTYNSDPLKFPEPKKKIVPKRNKKTRGRSARGNATENGEGPSRVLRSRTSRLATTSKKLEQETKVEETKVKETIDGRKLPKGWIYLTDEDDEEEGNEESIPLINGIEYQVPVVDNDNVIATRTRSRKSSVSEMIIKTEDDETEMSVEPLEVVRRSRSNSQNMSEAALVTTPNSEITVQTRSRKGSIDSSTAEITNVPFGSLVWAKMQGFPWYPAEVADPEKANITSVIRADKKEGDTYLVHFFDERKLGKKSYNRSWKWVPANKIILMGDEKTDLAKLKDRGMKNKMKREIPNAYEAACKSKGREPVLLDQFTKSITVPLRRNSRNK